MCQGTVDEASRKGGRGDEGVGWDSMKDHSKWGVSTAGLMSADQYDELGQQHDTRVCLGDLNRQPSQRFRGGGYVCSSDPRVWIAFRSLVVELEPCPTSAAP